MEEEVGRGVLSIALPFDVDELLVMDLLWDSDSAPEQHFGSHRQWHRIHHRVHVRGWVFYVLRWEESERCVTDLIERVYLHRHHALFGAFSHSFSSSSVSHHRSSLCHRWNFAIHFFSFHHGIGIYINNIIYICIRIETLIKP